MARCQQMPKMRNALGFIDAHEVLGQEVMKWCAAHLPDTFDHTPGFFNWELRALVSVEEADILKNLIADAGFVMDMKLPSLLLGVAVRRLPLGQPLAPVLLPFCARFHLNKERLWILAVAHVAQAVVHKKVGSVGVRLPIAGNEWDLDRLRDDFQDCEAEFLADYEIPFQCGLELYSGLAPKGVDSRNTTASHANTPYLAWKLNFVAAILHNS